MQKKLKDTYALVEQLYTGVQRVICATSYDNAAPTLIKDTLDRLSMTPAQIEELKRSAAGWHFTSTESSQGMDT